MDIVERLKRIVVLDEVGSNNPLARDAADTIEALRRERDELKKWNEYLANHNETLAQRGDDLEEQLAASQARERQLREALGRIMRSEYGDACNDWACDALALPHDDTALKQWGAKLLRDAGYLAFLQSLDFDVYLNRMADELEGKK